MNLKGSKTLQNLYAAFAGETQARGKYTIYAKKAKKEGYEQLSAIFDETAKNEQAHAKLWFEEIVGGIQDTEKNLADARQGEHYEWTEMYANFAREAKDEGFHDIARKFEMVAAIEQTHDNRYTRLLENMKNGEVFARPESVKWICTNCGYIHEGEKAPEVCPVCNHPRAYFEIKAQNY